MDYVKNKLAELGLPFYEKEIESYLEQAVKQMNDSKIEVGGIDTIKPEGSV